MNKIECPNCKCEYLPAEIFIPKYLLGTPEDIEKDIYGKIINFSGRAPSLQETYICDRCNKKFNITVDMQFNVTKETILDFDEEYTAPLYTKDRLILEE